MDLGLGGKVAVVTGASKGIGLAVTAALVAEGAYVVAGARSLTDDLAALVDGGSVEHVAVDLATPAAADALVAATQGRGLDILVNNIGAVGPLRPMRWLPQPRAAAWTSWSTTSGRSVRDSTASQRSPTRTGSSRST